MKLIICEKPSVGMTIAAALGIETKKDGYMESADFLVSWQSFPSRPAMENAMKNGTLKPCLSCLKHGSLLYQRTRKNSFPY